MLSLLLIAQTWVTLPDSTPPVAPPGEVVVVQPAGPAVSFTFQRQAGEPKKHRTPARGTWRAYDAAGKLVDTKTVYRYWDASKSLWVKDQPAASKPVVRHNYNLSWSGATWNLGGIRKTRQSLIDHLMGRVGARQHRGKFSERILKTLTFRELDALHSNDHVGRPFTSRAPPQQAVIRASSGAAFCPT